jgi:heterodisulfide reductase subunit A
MKGISSVNEALCKGCGACTAICPNKAARQNHFTQGQVLAEVDSLVEKEFNVKAQSSNSK